VVDSRKEIKRMDVGTNQEEMGEKVRKYMD
jgi:hypothetical protein